MPRARSFPLRVAASAALVLGLAVACTSSEIVAWDEPDASNTIPVPEGGVDTASVSRCGNGVLDPGEGCDDRNTVSGDGCSAECKVEDVGSSCPGTTITLAPSGTGRTAVVSGNTSSGISSLQSNTCGGGTGADLVYVITPDITGAARVKLNAQFDAILGVRTMCAIPSSEVSCKTVPVGGGATEILLPVTSGQTFYLVVDGVAGKSGPFTLDVNISASVCGDGVAQYPEQCDDGNTANADGCSSTCALEGTIAPKGECPGAPYTLVGSATGPKKISFAGDIALLENTMASWSSGGAGRDQVYAVTPTANGSLSVELRGDYVDQVLHIRGECFSSQSQIDEKAEPLASVPVRMTFPVLANQTYFLFADTATAVSAGPASGIYTLDVTLTPPECADGVLQGGEECDDGNTIADDGCSPACTLEPTPGLDSCPGATLVFDGPVGGPMTAKRMASTAALTADVRGCGNVGRKDAVFSFIAPFNGWLKVKADADFDLDLGLRRDCLPGDTSIPTPDPGAVVCASDSDLGDGIEEMEGPVEAGQTYFIIVNGGFGNANNEGVFTLEASIVASVCGNGRIEGGEECDDGATIAGDACDPTCIIEPSPPTRRSCGTAEDLALTESSPGVYTVAASYGNWNLYETDVANGDFGGGYFAFPCAGGGQEAYYKVTAPISGVVTVSVDASYNVSIGARAACPPNTSNGFLNCSNKTPGPGNERYSFRATQGSTYWLIVDSASTRDKGSFTMNVEIKGESCGDGLVTGVEECDDGNVASGDGCSATCTLEPLMGLDTCPGHALTITGVGAAPREKVVTFSTSSLVSDYAASCGGNGRDGVVAVTSDLSGTMTAQLRTPWPTVFYARTTCTDSSSAAQLGCQKSNPATPHLDTREISFPVVAGVPVYFFVDSLDGSSGAATLTMTVTP